MVQNAQSCRSKKEKFIDYQVAQPPVRGMKYEHQNWDTNVISYIFVLDPYLKAETKKPIEVLYCLMWHGFVLVPC